MSGLSIRKDLLGGGLLLAVGAAFCYHALTLGVGTARVMGAGYFPMLAGGFLILTAVLTLLAGIRSPETVERPPWRSVAAVIAGVAAFIAVVPWFGLLPAIVATVLLAAGGDPQSRPVSALLLALGLATGAWLVFLLGLGLSIPAFRLP
jgi:hypothetical protein